MRKIWGFVGRILKSTKAWIIIGLVLLNILTVTSFKMFDIVSSLVRMATVPIVSMIDDGNIRKRPTWGEAVKKTDDLEAKSRSKSAEIDDLNSRNKKLTRDLEVSARRQGELELDLAKTKTRNADEVARLTTDNRNLRNQMADQLPTSSNKAVRREVKERVSSLMSRISRSTAMEVGSAPAELSAIGPGTLVALGLLIYEVRDTCLQMGELKELYDLVSLPGEKDELAGSEMDRICGLSAEDLKDHIFSKTPQEACQELRAELQQVEVIGCEEFPVANPNFEVPDLDEGFGNQSRESDDGFVLPELD